MRTIIIAYLCLTLFNEANSQKMYVWCPEATNLTIRTEELKDVNLNVLIQDSRTFTKKVRSKCTSETIVNTCIDNISQSFPSARINIVSDNQKKNQPGEIFIRIEVKSYYSIFNSPHWIGQTVFNIEIVDSRIGDVKIYSNKIVQECKLYNTNGFNTGKKSLNNSYVEAISELLKYISISTQK
jgi:hypothetical protein